jgi:hypothetical protein
VSSRKPICLKERVSLGGVEAAHEIGTNPDLTLY